MGCTKTEPGEAHRHRYAARLREGVGNWGDLPSEGKTQKRIPRSVKKRPRLARALPVEAFRWD